MDDLTAFLIARLDEDDAQARDATAEPGMAAKWHETTSGCLDVGLPDHGGEDWRDYVWPQGDSRVTRFIACHDPARVLREVEAKRAILGRHTPHEPAFGGPACNWCSEDVDDRPQIAKERWPCPDVRSVAAIWSDHPDYRPEWASEPVTAGS